jgi:predicted CXXCH cytochrome family protein
MLYERVHPPVAKGMCAQCHEPATSKTPFQTRQAGAALCRGCHAQKLNEMLGKAHLHQPVMEGAACLNCHTAHASRSPGLLRADPVALCGRCHADTIARQANSPTPHGPVREGMCTSCHDPHASDVAQLFVQADNVQLCGTCHDYQTHSTHPIGDKRVDPRNKNLTLSCLSCHRAHGTEYKRMMPYAKQTDLCTKCHQQYQR